VLDWLANNYIEVLGVITSLIYLYFSVRQMILLWPFGIISSALFIYIFFSTRFYADMALQIYYLFISMYGWYHWTHGIRESSSDKLPVKKVNVTTGIVLLMIFGMLWISIGMILKHLTDSDVPWGDAFTTAGSIIATWMLARKILEHWLVWIIVDLVAAGLYFSKGMYPTLILYLIYSIIAVVGYYQWRKDL